MPDPSPLVVALDAVAPALAATALRAAVALAVVTVVQAALVRRTSATVRHALWAAALAVVLVLPAAEHPAVRAAAPTAVQVHRPLPVPPAHPVPSATQPAGDEVVGGHVPGTETPDAPGVAAAGAPQLASPADLPATPFPWAAALVAVWGLGAVLALGRLAVSAVAASRAVRQATPDADLSAEAGVPVRRSPDAAVPYAWGLWRPVVVVPPGFDAWPEPDRRAALAHEAAHARRRDPLVGLAARLARALHWFDPLAHYAAHRLDRERERAADDAVLRGGLAGVDYADLLVRAGRRALSGRPAPRLAPAHAERGQSALAERIGAVLDGRTGRGGLSRRTGVATAAVGLALGVGLSAFGTADHAPGAEPASHHATADTASAPAWYRPPPTAERWAPELHSPDGWTYTPTFTADLRTAYFVLWPAPDYSDPASIQELYTTRWSDTDRAWSVPERVAATAGSRVDWPHVSPDGRLYVSTTKPHAGHYRDADGRPLSWRTADFDLWAGRLGADGALDGATFRPLDGSDLNRQKTPETARIGYVHNETAPRTDRAGRLYFWTERLDDGGGRRDVYLAEPDGAGGYRTPALLPFNTAARESGVAVDPGGRWVVFASEGRGGSGRSDLFVVARDGDRWGEPVNLGPEVNTRYREDSPEVSPDGRTLFFSTNRPGEGIPTVDSGEGVGPAASVFWVDLEAVPAFVRATR